MPWLPHGKTVVVPGRGEFFVRQFEHADPHAPILLLLHGWTANTDMQFFTAYQQLTEKYSFVGIDHRGHGRGLRSTTKFSLEDCADDAAAVLQMLNISQAIAVGYSMGGPIAMLLCRRHPDLVKSLVLQATALEWSATRRERNRWRVSRVSAPVLRRLNSPSVIRITLRRFISRRSELHAMRDWIVGEIRRNDTWTMSQAGVALSTYDARPWAHELGVPCAVVITTSDRLVRPDKQYRLAETMGAHIVPLDGDHFVTLVSPQRYATATRIAVDYVAHRSPSVSD